MEPSEPTTKKAGRWKRVVWGVIAALVLALVLFFVGLRQGRQDVQDLEIQLEDVRTELTELQERLQQTQSERQMALARAALYRTALDLEARNFGTANERLQEAAQLLSDVQSPGEEVAGLLTEIRALNLRVAADLEEQRARVLEFASRLNSLSAGSAPPDGETP